MALNALLDERCRPDGRGGFPALPSLQPLGHWGVLPVQKSGVFWRTI